MNDFISFAALAMRRLQNYAFAIVALVLGTGLFLLIPRTLGTLIETIGDPEGLEFNVLIAPVGLIAAILIAQAILSAIHNYLVTLSAEQIGNELRATFFARLIDQPYAQTRGQKLGGTASEFVSDIAIMQSGLSTVLIAFLRHAVFTIGAFVAMFIVNWQMALISIASVLVVAGVISVFIHFATKASIRTQVHRANTVSLLLEAANNAYVIKAYEKSRYFDSLFRERLNTTYDEISRNLRLMSLINPVSLVVFAIAIFVILAYGTQSVASGQSTIADLVSFITYAMVLIASTSQLGVNFGKMKQAVAMYQKHRKFLDPIIDPPTAHDNEPNNHHSNGPPPGFRLDEVSFVYQGTDKPALAKVSLEVPSAKITIVVGESGAGKSTLAAVLVGLLKPTSGMINRNDGRTDNSDLAIVPQHPFLFSGTIADNIRFGRPHITDAAIKAAAATAQIDRHIKSLPDGFDNEVEEGGKNFSRGQAQRIALARALAGDPRVLILDEATASLDVISERAIRDALLALRGQTTIVVIAHHGELLSIADHLLVLGNGHLEFAGNPQASSQSKTIAAYLPHLGNKPQMDEVGA